MLVAESIELWLRWYGHVLRKDEDWVEKGTAYEVNDKKVKKGQG